MFKLLISSFYFFLPAYFTNMTPPLAKKLGLLNFLDKPIDFGKIFVDGKPLLGSHKTWRGAVCGVIAGLIVIFFQSWLFRFPAFADISLFNYRQVNIPALGLLLSGGAVAGDVLFALVKRRLNLKPGAPFIPFDQTNYVIGSSFILTLFPIVNIPMTVWITLLLLTFFLHIAVNRLGYILNLHQAKW